MLRLLFLLIFLPNLLLAQIEYSTNEYNSLWSIAIEVKKDNPDFSLYQIMIAIQDLNPDSFKQRNINYSISEFFSLDMFNPITQRSYFDKYDLSIFKKKKI